MLRIPQKPNYCLLNAGCMKAMPIQNFFDPSAEVAADEQLGHLEFSPTAVDPLPNGFT
jgi:hypothetical protein